MANIKDVAQRSGYSVATVSRALNHHGYVSATAQAKIEDAIADLNYVPNGVAQDLSQGKTFTIGVVLPHMNHPYFNQLVHGILTAAFSSAYQISLLPSRYDVAVETKYLTQLKRKLFDGLIFASHEASLQYLAERQS
ncbi:LacI family DNA-binding transcriptional regulator [Limosilactobacillus ingluviei]